MTCRAPLLAELIAVVYGDVSPEAASCGAAVEYWAIVPEDHGVQLAGAVCGPHAAFIAQQLDGVRLVKKRT